IPLAFATQNNHVRNRRGLAGTVWSAAVALLRRFCFSLVWPVFGWASTASAGPSPPQNKTETKAAEQSTAALQMLSAMLLPQRKIVFLNCNSRCYRCSQRHA